MAASVNVAVLLRSESEEATEEAWDPTTAVVRSRHLSGDRDFLTARAQGVAGAQANLPPRVAGAPPADAGEGAAGADGETGAPDPAAPDPVRRRPRRKTDMCRPTVSSKSTDFGGEPFAQVFETLEPEADLVETTQQPGL